MECEEVEISEMMPQSCQENLVDGGVLSRGWGCRLEVSAAEMLTSSLPPAEVDEWLKDVSNA